MTAIARHRRLAGSAALVAALLAALAPGAPTTAASPAPGATPAPDASFGAERITLQTHSSFALSPGVLAGFEATTGVAVEILAEGDAGSMVNQAILSKDHPLADVLFGVDTTFLSRALDAGIFEPYRPAALADVPAELLGDPDGQVTPIDVGDVCVNLDLAAFGGEGQPPLPATLEDLARPEYRGMLVVEDPATSSPGLAFLLATVTRYGETGPRTWRDYWAALRANDVAVAGDWTNAYFGRFSGGANGGDRPMVVSYASSPVAEVVFADPRPATAPTGVLLDGCFRQVEYAGVLAGTDAPAEARAFIDFLLSPAVQSDIPLTMFVSPVLPTAVIPADYAAWAAVPEDPLWVDPAAIDANRERWIEEWAETVLR